MFCQILWRLALKLVNCIASEHEFQNLVGQRFFVIQGCFPEGSNILINFDHHRPLNQIFHHRG